MLITLIILRKRGLPKMLVFGVFLILLSVCNSHPQNANGYPPLDTEDNNKVRQLITSRINPNKRCQEKFNIYPAF